MRYIKAMVLFSLMLALLSFTACGNHQVPIENIQPSEEAATTVTNKPASDLPEEELPETPKPPFEGKIAFITQNLFYYDSAKPVIDKYGKDKVIRKFWPDGLLYFDLEKTTSIVMELVDDPEIKVIIVNNLFSNTYAAFEQLNETRKDIYVIFCQPEISSDGKFSPTADNISPTADLIVKTDFISQSSAIARQAQKLGAEKFVYYSSQTIDHPPYPLGHEIIKQVCNELDIEFIDATYPLSGYPDYLKFIQNDFPMMVQKHGKNTAFFATGGYMNLFIDTVIMAGAICPQAGNPSCFENFIGFLDSPGIFFEMESSLFEYLGAKELTDVMGKPYPLYSEYLMTLVRPYLEQYNMLGRISAWPVDDRFMSTITAAEYAVKWINGEVPKEGVDVEVLKQLMEDFTGVEVYLTPYTDEYPYNEEGTGETYDNFLLMNMDFITFE